MEREMCQYVARESNASLTTLGESEKTVRNISLASDHTPRTSSSKPAPPPLTKLDEAPLLCNLRSTSSLAAHKGAHSQRLGILVPLDLFLRLHTLIQSDLQRYTFQQVVEYCHPRYVSTSGDQSDGAGDVSVSRVGAKG